MNHELDQPAPDAKRVFSVSYLQYWLAQCDSREEAEKVLEKILEDPKTAINELYRNLIKNDQISKENFTINEHWSLYLKD